MAPAPVQSAERPRLPLGKRIGFALLALGLIGLLSEGVLALFGVRPDRDEVDPSAGFSSRTPLFVEERGPDGRVLLRHDLTRYDSPEAERWRQRYGIHGVPTVIFLTPDGREVREARVEGFLSPELFI